ncbi:MAG: 1-phosphofructokinase [Clostridia bacterium]|nr:1-phosphofructokinase [Clostridia bacterium]
MITVVCLSPCIDRTISVPSFTIGETNRPVDTQECIGGKGVNVALMLKSMGADVQLITFRHAKGGDVLEKGLQQAKLSYKMISTDSVLRTNIKILDKSCNEITEINEKATPVEDAVIDEIKDCILAEAAKSRWLVLTGSMPRGCAADFYAQIIREKRHAKLPCKVVLDAEGEPLRDGVPEKPDFMKPNRHELEIFEQRALPTNEDILQATAHLEHAGIETVITSMGTAGSVMVTAGKTYAASAVKVPVVTTVGAGDAMVAGFLKALEDGKSVEEAFRYSVASATARVAGEADGTKYLEQVQIREMM